MSFRYIRTIWFSTALVCAVLLTGRCTQAEPPYVSYLFPAGGQRGTTVNFKVGGHYLHDGCDFEMRGPGINASSQIERTDTVWFEGPFVPKPLSQRAEDYPTDYAGRVTIDSQATLGTRYWHVWNSQGVTPLKPFVVGDLPEVVEKEIDGSPIPVSVKLPVTVNGRIFPREDVDVWEFVGKQGDVIHCSVMSERLGFPLDARLELRDEKGILLVENDDFFGNDSHLRFTLPANGRYLVHVTDVNYNGLQNYVYRLTLSTGPRLDGVYPLGGRRGNTTAFELFGHRLPENKTIIQMPTDGPGQFVYRPPLAWSSDGHARLHFGDFPEYLELTEKPADDFAQKVTLPATLNGRITAAGENDHWTFSVNAGQTLELNLLASRLGSPLDSFLTLVDESGEVIATSDDIGNGQTDSTLTYDVKKDCQLTAVVADRFRGRGGRRYAYRLLANCEKPKPDFHISFPSHVLAVDRAGEVKFKVDAEKLGGFDKPIQLTFESLPEHVLVENTTIDQGKTSVEVTIKVDSNAEVARTVLAIYGEAEIDGQCQKRLGTASVTELGDRIDELFFAVTVPTPFLFTTQFEQKFASRGSVYLRDYELVRNGFEGPVEISLADRQVRHRQGVNGPTIVVPAGETHFAYPLQLAPYMEVGRTSRTNLMAVGTVVDMDGRRHKVSFTTFDVGVQIITLTDPGRLSLTALTSSVLVRSKKTVDVPLRIGRVVGLTGPVTVAIKPAAHMKGISAQPVVIPAGETDGHLLVEFSDGSLGPFNMPLMLEATMFDSQGMRVYAQCELPFVIRKPESTQAKR